MPVKPHLGEEAGGAAVARRRAGVRVPGGVYRLLRLLVHLINRVYWRVEVDGAEAVPETGPVILAPIHRSFMDFFVVSEVTKRKIFYMTKEEMWKSPLLGSFLDSVGAFPVHRDGPDRLALERAQDVLERGDVLILFPEGTRRVGPVVDDLHEGAAFLAARTGAAIVPIGIGGTAEAMPKGSKFVRPVKVHIVVGPALAAPARSERGRVPRTQVHALTERLCAELQTLYDDAEDRAKPPARPGR
jgi:1-acyl-sn-glycerol-3-phosphate acyltransferase